MSKAHQLKIFVVYLFFITGGILHILNVLQEATFRLASPLIIAVSLLFFFDVIRGVTLHSRTRFIIWSFLVFFFGWSIEYIGLTTDFPFGSYQYGQVLEPQILQVPLAIGFAWLTICLSSLVISYRLLDFYKVNKVYYNFLLPFLTAALMLIFDIFMEHAAPKLDYWTWYNNEIPIQNYLSWFILGWLFAYIWVKLKISLNLYSTFAKHVYLAQFIYFVIVIFK